MASYASIADISEQIQERLRTELVPELVISPEGVALCSPGDKGDASVGIFLYDIQESDEIRQHRMIDVSRDRQQYPPAYLTLFYMITAYSTSDRRYRMSQEEKILGRIIQFFHDHPSIGTDSGNVQVRFQSVSTEDKLKLWNFPNEPYRISLFYQVSPVRIASALYRDVDRVRAPYIHVEHTGQPEP